MSQLVVVNENNEIMVANEYLESYANYLKVKAEAELKEQQFKEELLKAMEEHSIKSYENDLMKVTFQDESTRKSLDSKRLKAECPEIYEAYTNESKVKSCIKIHLK